MALLKFVDFSQFVIEQTRLNSDVDICGACI